MRARGVNSYREYLEVLNSDPREYDEIINTLTINVTEFFRDPAVYDLVEDLLRDMATRKRRIRIWSAGCSSGEEPYSLAILCKETLEDLPRVRITATDIDREIIKRAKKGVYGPTSLKNAKPGLRKKYFSEDAGRYAVSDEVKSLVQFKHHDLLGHRRLSGFEMIFCRNVMFYFSRELQRDLFTKFYDALEPGGYLVIGKTETLVDGMADKFNAISTREKVYQKI